MEKQTLLRNSLCIRQQRASLPEVQLKRAASMVELSLDNKMTTELFRALALRG
jgi:hypothetical protein